MLLPASAPWVEDYIEELAIFPAGAHDDQVDATSQALLRLALRGQATTQMVEIVYDQGERIPLNRMGRDPARWSSSQKLKRLAAEAEQQPAGGSRDGVTGYAVPSFP